MHIQACTNTEDYIIWSVKLQTFWNKQRPVLPKFVYICYTKWWCILQEFVYLEAEEPHCVDEHTHELTRRLHFNDQIFVLDL
jgi:hypothetical protein